MPREFYRSGDFSLVLFGKPRSFICSDFVLGSQEFLECFHILVVYVIHVYILRLFDLHIKMVCRPDLWLFRLR